MILYPATSLTIHTPMEKWLMQDYQRDFIRYALEKGALRFGRFTLKSGRQSPYFFNAGLFDDGSSLARLGRFYASALLAADIEFDMLFGPAYKGIPLAAAVAIALAEEHGRNVPFAFNRKEVKDHGEGGSLVGAPVAGRVLIVDDVITAGLSVREAVELITAAGGRPVGVAIALDRQERGVDSPVSAVQEVERLFGFEVTSIVGLEDVLRYLQQNPGQEYQVAAIEDYRRRYGS